MLGMNLSELLNFCCQKNAWVFWTYYVLRSSFSNDRSQILSALGKMFNFGLKTSLTMDFWELCEFIKFGHRPLWIWWISQWRMLNLSEDPSAWFQIWQECFWTFWHFFFIILFVTWWHARSQYDFIKDTPSKGPWQSIPPLRMSEVLVSIIFAMHALLIEVLAI